MLTHTHSFAYTWTQHTHVDRHMHYTLMYSRVHTCIHTCTQCHASRDLPLRPDTHAAQEASVRRLQPGWRPGQKRAQVKDLSCLRGSRECMFQEVEAGRGGERRRAGRRGCTNRGGGGPHPSAGLARPQDRVGGPHTEAGRTGPRNRAGGTSAHGRPRRTLGQGGGISPLGRPHWTLGQDGGTSARGRARQTPGQSRGTSGRVSQATAGGPGAQGA